MAQGLQKRIAPVLFKQTELFSNAGIKAMSVWWNNVPMGPPDAILGITEAYRRDTDPKKVNLGVGAYRDDAGNPWVLPSVRKAEEIVYGKCLNHEYAPISGDAKFTEVVGKLVFGENNPIFEDKCITSVQALSGTGALRLGFEFIKKFYAFNKVVYLPKPTWGNHTQMCNGIGLENKTYRYFDPNTIGFDLNGALEDICNGPTGLTSLLEAIPLLFTQNMPEGSVILLHACAHNPTGVDPRPEEWEQLSSVIKHKKLMVFFDSAYQGFASGNVDNDAFAIRKFVADGHEVILAQSFAKNMGMYGERVGAFHMHCGDKETAAKAMSQLKILIRIMYSNPPVYGARIVTEILSNPELKKMWLRDVKTMADRIINMRKRLRDGVEAGTKGKSWKHITDQIGMFCYTGLKPDQVARLTKEFHVYLTKDGRISMAGVSSKNVDHVAQSIAKVASS